ncbi:hypothetical protein BJF79_37295 [Actinomadura sp. CNU-125]|uniref:hypothetical protein n=1 Tax=Actinomadura sp. CNU-125 TaxID=1904961 RepID=UPI000959289C|nr:hypothetical protein [Actinomadura sp. CNU-125]OLT31388.1 hypothetical protein BJF79_37295 [Actinomadura sp. CNU-125]
MFSWSGQGTSSPSGTASNPATISAQMASSSRSAVPAADASGAAGPVRPVGPGRVGTVGAGTVGAAVRRVGQRGVGARGSVSGGVGQVGVGVGARRRVAQPLQMGPQDPLGRGLHVDVHVQPVEDVLGGAPGRVGGTRRPAVGTAALGGGGVVHRRDGVGRHARVPQRRQHRVGEVRGEIDQRGVGVGRQAVATAIHGAGSFHSRVTGSTGMAASAPPSTCASGGARARRRPRTR